VATILKRDDETWLDVAADAIHRGKVVALPFERLFGLAANALDPETVSRIATIKGREGTQTRRPIAVILPNIEAVSAVTDRFFGAAKQLAETHWPGPLTLLVPALPSLPSPLVSNSGLIGIRVAGPSPAALLAARTALPLTATSANHAGAPDALSHEEVIGLSGVDFIVEGAVSGPPGSTVVDVSHGRPRVLRQGIFHIEEEL
jgi:L-threonylcarbamoyladenylate synthase